MGNDRTDQTIKLKDGRTLGYAEYGNPEGQPGLSEECFGAAGGCCFGQDGYGSGAGEAAQFAL